MHSTQFNILFHPCHGSREEQCYDDSHDGDGYLYNDIDIGDSYLYNDIDIAKSFPQRGRQGSLNYVGMLPALTTRIFIKDQKEI